MLANKKYIALLAGLAIIVITITALAITQRNTHELPEKYTSNQDVSKFTSTDLKLPFNLSDISNKRGGTNPLGVVRFAEDEGHTGHPGIDVPLFEGAEIYAVADGPVHRVVSAGDPRDGQGVYQLIDTNSPGEGWMYIYEHIIPTVKADQQLKAGDLIGTKAAPEGFTAHFQLSYVSSDYQYNRGAECWPDYLNSSDKQQLDSWWSNRITDGQVAANWTGNISEGTAPFEGLLDKTKFPQGPQLCYPPGTDAR